MDAVAGSDLMIRQTSSPLKSGRFTSSRIMPGISWANLSASVPVAASVTPYPARSKILLLAYREAALSSTLRIVCSIVRLLHSSGKWNVQRGLYCRIHVLDRQLVFDQNGARLAAESVTFG